MATLVLRVADTTEEDHDTLQKIDFLRAFKQLGIDQVIIIRDESYAVKVDPYLIVDKRIVLVWPSFEFDWLGNRKGVMSMLKLKFNSVFGKERFLILD